MLARGDGKRLGLASAGCELPAAGVPGAGAELADWAARAPVLCRPVTVISVALIAATTHSVTAATAVTAPGLPRSLPQPRPPRSGPDPAAASRSRDGTGIRSTEVSEASVTGSSGAVAVQEGEREAARSSTGSRNPAGSAGSGSSRASTSGRSDPCLLPAQISQVSMCRAAIFPVRAVSFPSQPASKAPSSGHDCRPVRAMSSASMAFSRCSRACEARVCARLQETSSTVASSDSSRPCRTLSSMTSCSSGLSSERISRRTRRTTACSAPAAEAAAPAGPSSPAPSSKPGSAVRSRR